MTVEFPEIGAIRFPKSYTKGRKIGQPTVIFIHTTEGSEGRTSAEDGAAYDQRRTDGTSTHFFVDENSAVQCVPTTDEAHAARSHGNDVGIQIEVCGHAAQSVTQWADVASEGAVRQAARVAVLLRKKYPGRFPLVNLTPAQLADGKHGFAEHLDATKAWPSDGGTHTDPGPNFPWAHLFSLIKATEAVNNAEGKEAWKMSVSLAGFSLPILVQGDDDGKMAGYNYVHRAQTLLNFVVGADLHVDGVYGDATTAAVKKLPGDNSGKTIGLAEWVSLYGLSKAAA